MFFSERKYILRLIEAIKNESGEVSILDSEDVLAHWGHLWSWTLLFEGKKAYVINSAYIHSSKWVGLTRRQEMHINGKEYTPFLGNDLYNNLLSACQEFFPQKTRLIEKRKFLNE